MRFASPKSLLDDPDRAWAPFEPDRSHPWDLASVSHLHRRAGFAAPGRSSSATCTTGLPPASIGCSTGSPRPATAASASDFESFLDAMAAKLAPSADLTGLQAIWLYRMIFTPHPLRERMTLFWHNHFATSIAKVRSAALMQRQNNLFRNAGPGRLSRLAPGDRQGSGHADLAGFDHQPQGQAQRELCPRGDGALQPRPGPLHREGRPGSRPGVHRLVRGPRRIPGGPSPA